MACSDDDGGSAFVVRVAEAESRVAALRQRFDASARLGVPAHVTLLHPFMPPRRITADVLQRARAALAAVPAFAYRLREVRRFPATAWLAPEPPAPFVALTEALVRAFPGFPPFGGAHPTIVPHLTVAHGNAEEASLAAAELAALMRARGPIECSCHQVCLLENADGRWRERQLFELPGRRTADPT